ncbi:MAG: TetR/AcrR family transcriptional regulator [Pseudomonadota bacterium]
MSENLQSSWIEPTQSRSRAKVERILDAAITLAARHQTLDFKMTEVAKLAKVAIGTLYQFFPSRSALIEKLFAREMAPVDASISSLFETSPARDQLADHVESLMRQHLNWVRTQPGLSVIWSAPQFHPDIERADLNNTKTNATVLAGRMKMVLPDAVPLERIESTALLVCHLWSSVIRLCALVDDERAEDIIAEYSAMVVAHGAALAQP